MTESRLPNTRFANRAALCLAGLFAVAVLFTAPQPAWAQASSPLADELSPPLPEEVPNVVSMRLGQALDLLGRAGFKVKAIPKYTYFVGEHNKVYAQSPRAGKAIAFKLPVVQLFYYDKDYQPKKKAAETEDSQQKADRKTVRVPDINGYSIESASSLLSRLGLRLEIEDELDTYDLEQDGTIFFQNPMSYALVKPGSVVRVGIYNYNGEWDQPKTMRQRKLYRERMGLPPRDFGQPMEPEGDELQGQGGRY